MLRPPHRPLSVVTTIAPTRFTVSRRARNGCLYSVFALATCIAICSARSTYGRDARIRSWAFFIFEAETISIAFVILRVLCTLLILFRISLDRHLVLAHRARASQYAPFFLKSSTAAASAFSSSAERSLVFSSSSISAAYLLFRYARSADSNASAFSTGTSS